MLFATVEIVCVLTLQVTLSAWNKIHVASRVFRLKLQLLFVHGEDTYLAINRSTKLMYLGWCYSMCLTETCDFYSHCDFYLFVMASENVAHVAMCIWVLFAKWVGTATVTSICSDVHSD